MKKKIGITFSETSFENYLKWFEDSDVDVVVISSEDVKDFRLMEFDGFVLTGGIDTHPALYGGSVDYDNRPAVFNTVRDLFESRVYTHARAQGIPVLGICRGMQLVNIVEGGGMVQDLGHEGNRAHRKEGGVDKSHVVRIEEGSLMQELCGALKGTTNSAHHQAVDAKALPSSLRITAWSEDGVPEAMEHSNPSGKSFMLCVQWHPERMGDREVNPLSKNIRERFLKEVRSENIRRMDIVNPTTEEVIARVAVDDEETLQQKFRRLSDARQAWSKRPLNERLEILSRFHGLLGERIEDLAKDLTAEVGKPLQQSRNEVNGARGRIAWMLANAERYLTDEIMQESDGMQERIRYEPLGVVCNISAWNYPYLVGVNVIVPALLAGNAVMYKPSEYATLTGLHIEGLLKEAGVPEDVFKIAIGDGAVGQILLGMDFHGYFFTGSHRTGKHIYETVAPRMVVCQCELGGKDPLYVADDIANVKSVAAATADGAFYNNGQSCCAVERIYVHERVYDAYVEEFVKEVRSWRMGDPTSEGVYLGPIARKANLGWLESQIADAVAKGAKVLTGGKRVPGIGYFFEPTVLVDVDHTMDVMHEESFGPVIGIMKVKDDEDALRLMNDTQYGLTASVYTAERGRGEAILTHLETGTGYINCCDRVSAALPWSGRRYSGFGLTLSHQGLRAFTRPKGMHVRE